MVMAKNDIRAIRDGQINYFHPNTWANMPDHKYGWTEERDSKPAPPPPAAVAESFAAAKPALPNKVTKPRGKRAKL